MKLQYSKSLSRPRSRGYLMVDLMIVMTLTMMVLSITSVWVYKTMLYSADVSQRDSHARNISRISRQLRIDAHDASALLVKDGLLTIDTLDDKRIEYLIDANSIRRKLAADAKTHHDRFEFATNAKLEWNSKDASDSVALNIRRDFSHLSVSKDDTTKRLDAQIRVRARSEAVK